MDLSIVTATAKLPDDTTLAEFNDLTRELRDVIYFATPEYAEADWRAGRRASDALLVRVQYGSDFVVAVGVATAVATVISILAGSLEKIAAAYEKFQLGRLHGQELRERRERRGSAPTAEEQAADQDLERIASQVLVEDLAPLQNAPARPPIDVDRLNELSTHAEGSGYGTPHISRSLANLVKSGVSIGVVTSTYRRA
ncbi:MULTISPECIES: hypothetical protein [Microbacterium]|uniref:hypothetical protein n=1 Tax=Microbacterium TaxID=33882 RepID=UPI0013A57836|nr:MULTISPECIES: hypothetical protein [Microbacterium]